MTGTDSTGTRVAAAVALTAALFSPRMRGMLRRGAVHGLAGMLTAGDVVASFARGVSRGLQESAMPSADRTPNASAPPAADASPTVAAASPTVAAATQAATGAATATTATTRARRGRKRGSPAPQAAPAAVSDAAPMTTAPVADPAEGGA